MTRTECESLYDDIPDGLKSFRQWVTWRPQPKMKPQPDGKVDKIPVNPRTGGNASVSEPETWGTFQDVARYERKGFVFTKKDPYVGIDLNGCRNPETGEIADWALDIMRRFPHMYWEASPSGTGVHGIGKGTLPPGGRKRGNIEVYGSGRFFTVTGDYVAGTTLDLGDHTAELAAWHTTVFGEKTSPRKKTRAKAKSSPQDLIRVKEALSHIPAVDYDIWLRVGMALHAAGDENFDYWVQWSQTCLEKFDLDVCRRKWRSFSADRDDAITVATIFQLAKGYGWCNGASGHPPPPEPKRAEAQPDQQIHASMFTSTDTGNAERLVRRYGQDLRYCYPWQKWVRWDGQRWNLDADGDVLRKAKETARAISTDEAKHATDDKQFKELLAWSKQSLNNTRLHAMVTLAQSESGVSVLPEHLDTSPWLLNCLNGTIDLRTSARCAADRAHLLTKLVPLPYNPSATAPAWERFLEGIFSGKQDLIHYIWKAIGYSLTGLTSEQCFFLCYGVGNNGKSTFLDILRALFADYAEQAEFSTFLRKDRDVIRNDLAKLRSTRLVAAIESDEGKRLSEALIKSLTGGDALTARFLFGEYFTFTPTFKIWLATNHKPEIRDTTHAMWRRVRLIPFTVVIPKVEQDKGLLDKLKVELEGILAWAVRGCLAWQQEGLEPPECVETATKAYQIAQDVLGAFLEECCLLQADLTAPTGDLYAAYKTWCGENNEKCLTQTTLAERLKEKGLENDRNSITGRKQWRSVGLRITPVERES